MFILDSLLVGGLRFILEQVAAVADAEMQDDSALRERLLEAQLRLELGEISDGEFAELERDVLARIREINAERSDGLTLASPGVKVGGVDIES